MTAPRTLPPKIKSIADLRKHLQAALELEHSTIPPYLCALYSLRLGHNREAAEIIRTVAVQEMLHMVLVANVLNAVGGAPSIAFKKFVPVYPVALPLGQYAPLEVPLRRFSREALTTFLAIEQPKPQMHAFTLTLKAAAPVPPGQLKNMVKAGTLYPSIGEFYAAIKQGLIALEDRAQRRGKSIFIGEKTRQVGPEHFYGAGGKAIPVSDLDTALAALKVIVEQGEGFEHGITDGDDIGGEREIAHYYRFDQLRLGRLYRPCDQPGQPTGAPISVDFGPDAVFPMMDNPAISRLPEGEIRSRGEAFASCYSKLLKLLQSGVSGEPEKLIESAVAMFDVRRLALDLLANPIDVDGAENAGPCFEFRP